MTATRARPAVTAALLALLAAGLSAPAAGQASGYHILLTNDDGIESAGIQILARQLKAVGEVHLVAPCGEMSGSSMSVALRAELRLEPVVKDGVTLGHCVDTSPAGAVLLAISALAPEGGFDVVISGINRGANVGTSSHMSGTVGGAMMGAFHGIPAVAASSSAPGMDFDYAARFVAKFVQQMKTRPAMPGIVFSINIPKATEAETAGVTVARMGGAHIEFAYSEVQGGDSVRRFRPRIGLTTSAPAGSDTDAFLHNMITITPIRFDWTAYPAIDQLKTWGLTASAPR